MKMSGEKNLVRGVWKEEPHLKIPKYLRLRHTVFMPCVHWHLLPSRFPHLCYTHPRVLFPIQASQSKWLIHLYHLVPAWSIQEWVTQSVASLLTSMELGSGTFDWKIHEWVGPGKGIGEVIWEISRIIEMRKRLGKQ